MATNNQNELAEFHHFVGEKLKNGGAALSPEEALDEWRAAHVSPEELAERVAALRIALSQADAGEGVPAEEVVANLRRKHNLPHVALDE